MRIGWTALTVMALACGDGSDKDDSNPPQVGCETPQPITTDLGEPTGFERCADGTVNRVDSWSGDPDHYSASYQDDAECNDGAGCGDPLERCVLVDWCMSYDSECRRVCGSDADCDADQVCVPPEIHEGWIAWPVCVAATGCLTGADCPSGECGFHAAGAEPQLAISCRTSADTCRTDEECREDNELYCSPNGEHWSCISSWDCD
jgi:hypothetical protein